MLNRERIFKVANELRRMNLDAVILGPSSDLVYLGGPDLHDDERFKTLWITSEGKSFSVASKLYSEEFTSLGADVPLYAWDDSDWFYGAAAQALMDHGLVGKRIAVNDGIRAVDALELMDRNDVNLVSGGHILSSLRICKEESEMSLMRQAGEISDVVISEVAEWLRPGLTEREVSKKIEELFLFHGAEGLAFETISACSGHGALPHYNDDSGVIGERDMILIDFGCRYRGYCSDCTRNFFFGEPNVREGEAYKVVRDAYLAGVAAVRPGATAQDVDRAARGVIERAGYGEYFTTRTGHGMGIAGHEDPYIMEGNDIELKPGMVFSVEPGIYWPGVVGIRIEDVVVVKDDGTAELLTHYPTDLRILE